MPLLSDEPTRAIVTLEMMVKGNYITPTINGEFYYNKPPLFNWILAGFAYLTGNLNEVIFRLPTVISLLLFALAIFLIGKKKLEKPMQPLPDWCLLPLQGYFLGFISRVDRYNLLFGNFLFFCSLVCILGKAQISALVCCFLFANSHRVSDERTSISCFSSHKCGSVVGVY